MFFIYFFLLSIAGKGTRKMAKFPTNPHSTKDHSLRSRTLQEPRVALFWKGLPEVQKQAGAIRDIADLSQSQARFTITEVRGRHRAVVAPPPADEVTMPLSPITGCVSQCPFLVLADFRDVIFNDPSSVPKARRQRSESG